MASDFPKVPLGGLVQNFDSKRVPLSSREREKRRGPYPYYGATGVMDHLDDYLFEGLHLLIAEDGSVETEDGYPFLQLVDGRFWVNNHAHVLRAQCDSDTRYLYHALSTVKIRPYMTGSVQAKLSQRNMNRILVPYADDALIRRAITCILGALDDKIELNRRMNQTLEAMARAIFKSWFVDFDPVRAKAEGRDPGLPDHIAALFPDRFEESELGEIPKGWRLRPLGEVCEFAYGKALTASQRRQGQVAVMGSNGQVGWHDSALARGPGLVIGRKGNPGVVTWVQQDFFPIDTTFFVVPKLKAMPLTYLYQALARLDLPRLGADSAVPGLNRNIAYMSPILVAAPDVSAVFDRQAVLLAERRHRAEEENRALVGLRDALLPKLISGELRVPDAEKIVGRAV